MQSVERKEPAVNIRIAIGANVATVIIRFKKKALKVKTKASLNTKKTFSLYVIEIEKEYIATISKITPTATIPKRAKTVRKVQPSLNNMPLNK